MLFIQTAIANAKTLEEVERLNNMLKTGQIPGKETKKPKCKFTFHFIISFFFVLAGDLIFLNCWNLPSF